MSEPARRSTGKPYTSTLRQRQAAQTRELILDAVTSLLGDRRADEVTTRDLATAAGVSERTVYRHFPDRDALLEGLSQRLPQLDGIKLCRLFRGALDEEELPHFARGCPTISAPIIFVTAYGARYTEQELRGLGGHMLITKPVDFNRLLSSVERVMVPGAAAGTAAVDTPVDQRDDQTVPPPQ